MDKRKRNPISLSDINNDDHSDNDYADKNKKGNNSNTLLHP
jgi:hypothetical protein